LSTVKTPLEILQELKPCTWEYKSETGLQPGIHYGFIAQDLLESFGSDYNFVDERADFLRVNYTEFIGVLASVVQQQQQDILNLQQELKELKEKQC